MCPRRKGRTAAPVHAPADVSDEKHKAKQEAEALLSLARKAKEIAQEKYKRMKSVMQDLARQAKSCPGSDIPFQEIEALIQQAEREGQAGASVEDLLKEGVQRMAEEMRKCYEDRHLNYPTPDFLGPFIAEGSINIAVTGGPDAGKSSCINTILGMTPGDPNALATSSIKQCTMTPKKVEYHIPFHGVTINVWDLPGGGTKEFPVETYVKDMGLRYFDCVLSITARTVLEAESKINAELKKWNVPYFVVRNKVDLAIRQAIDAKEDDLGHSPSQAQKQNIEKHVLDEIRQELTINQGLASKVYCIASRLKHRSDWDFQELKRDIVAAVKTGRRVDVDKDCPVCFEEYSDYGGIAGVRVTTPCCDHSVCRSCLASLELCPFCRRPLG